MLVERFYPDEYLDSTYSIDFAELAKKGYRGVLFDIDNTLVPHGAPADQKAKALFAHLRELGMDYCLISNNQLPRVKPFADAIGGKYIEDAPQTIHEKLSESNADDGLHRKRQPVCGGSALYRCLGCQKSRDAYHSG